MANYVQKVHPTASLIKLYFNDTIDECISAPRVRDFDLLPPMLHRQICISRICKVKGCREITSNECGICGSCHPVRKVVDFPCYYAYSPNIFRIEEE
jgi:hypothetical protein